MSKKNKSIWIVKIGSAIITRKNPGLNRNLIKNLAEQVAKLNKKNIKFIFVSSGSIAEGMKKLKLSKRPKSITYLQVLASIGQMSLVQAYETEFKKHKILTAQVLLTHDDLNFRERYLSIRSTVNDLIDRKIIPVINENDVTSSQEIKFGDNDTLAALVANLVAADKLIILTDQKGLYEDDPKLNKNAKLIKNIDLNDKKIQEYAKSSSSILGRGGMITKIEAAKKASKSGTETIIANGKTKDILFKIFEDKNYGTLIKNNSNKINNRKLWIINSAAAKGKIYIDDGAKEVLFSKGKSLLPIGIKKVEGNFKKGDVVICFDKNKTEVARGLVNYNSDDLLQIIGKSLKDIEKIYGLYESKEAIHRNNMVIS